MPPKGKLSNIDIAAIKRWIKGGAIWPRKHKPSHQAADEFKITEADRNYWAFLPLNSQAAPSRSELDSWSSSPIDAFVSAKLAEAGMHPAAQADDRTLIRRLSINTLGLPPTRRQIAAFLSDKSPTRYENLVDRVLASPHYGEKMARYWMDVVGFVETAGHVTDPERQGTWQYRDYLIRAFNEDLSFDQFLTEHLAGDLIRQRVDAATKIEQSVLGTCFLWFYPYHFKPVDPIKQRWDQIDAQIDVIGKAFLGLTLACARCHDHKFDAISQQDYYALANFLNRTHNEFRQLLPRNTYTAAHSVTAKRQQIQKQIEKGFQIARADRNAKLGNVPYSLFEDDFDLGTRQRLMGLRRELAKLDANSVYATVAIDSSDDTDIRLNIRGSYKNPGGIVKRRFLTVLSNSEAGVATFEGSGRRELASSMLHGGQSLVARVIVNRLWYLAFGRGIVNTPGNFGRNGERPSHPALLDYLAGRLIEKNWSLKQLHREILCSKTFQQSSTSSDAFNQKDPQNVWLHRANVRRMNAETLFDSVRFTAGSLDSNMFGESIPPYVSPFAIMNKPQNVPASGPIDANGRRAVYVKIRKNFVPPFLKTFDFPKPAESVSKRDQTLVPEQSLTLMNGEFIHQQSQRWGKKLAIDSRAMDVKIRETYEVVTGQTASDVQLRTLKEFVRRQSTTSGENGAWADFVHVLWNLNRFLFVQ